MKLDKNQKSKLGYQDLCWKVYEFVAVKLWSHLEKKTTYAMSKPLV